MGRLRRGLAALVAAGLGATLTPLVAAATAETYTFPATADARVAEASPNSNYGTSTYLRADGGSDPDVESYLRFDVAGLSGSVSTAKLRLYATAGSGVKPAVYATGTGWTEAGLTWATRPARTSGATDDKGPAAAGWVEWELTPLVRGAGTYSFLLATTSTDGANFDSRQAGSKPQLVVTTSPPDTQPPTAPTSVAATGVTATAATLSWAPASDDRGVAGYNLYLDGVKVAAATATTYTFGALSCGRAYTVGVEAYDAAGNRSPVVSARVTTLACSPPAGPRYAVRGVYDRDLSPTGFDELKPLGFNFIDSGASRDFTLLAHNGLKGFVWLGGYSNATCSFRETDAWVREHVLRMAGNPGVGAYFIDDEPDAALCLTAPGQIMARSRLVKSLDPGPPTFIVTNKTDQYKLYAGTVDILGLDRYPCSVKYGCQYEKIHQQAAEADRLGIRYWGIIQAHGTGGYRVPTPEELHQQFEHWRSTNMEGYLVFAWRWPVDDPTLWLARNEALKAQLAIENAR